MTEDPVKNIVLDLLYKPELGKLIPEPDKSGNIEYKLMLDKKDKRGQDNMVSQMLWRMNEGKNTCGRYEAHYILGVHDDGSFSTITESSLNLTTNILRGVAKKANSKIVSEKIYVFGERMLSHVVVRKKIEERSVREMNMMIMGPSAVGKSSLMGRLTYGQKDDGNGFTRKLVLRHMHEKSSGSTSCSKYDTIGFSGDNLMNYSIGIEFNLENVYSSSDRLINLIDVPGDMRYIKTILYSVSSIRPDSIIVCIPCKTVVQSNIPAETIEATKSTGEPTEITETTKTIETTKITEFNALEYVEKYSDDYKFIIAVCLSYDIKPIVVLTKTDLIDIKIDITKYRIQLAKIFNRWKTNLMGIEKIIELKKDDTDIDANIETKSSDDNMFDSDSTESSKCDSFDDITVVPVSNVTDLGYPNLISCLSKLRSDKKTDSSKRDESDRLFIINDAFTIPDTGTIFHGTMRYGTLNVDETVDILCHGVISEKKIKSIHRKTLDVEKLFPGESGSIKFYGDAEKTLDKTAMIIGKSWQKKIITKALVMSVFDTVKIKSQQYMMFVDNTITTVILAQSEEPNIYVMTCFNNSSFIPESKIGMLKDEQQNYYFIRFL